MGKGNGKAEDKGKGKGKGDDDTAKGKGKGSKGKGFGHQQSQVIREKLAANAFDLALCPEDEFSRSSTGNTADNMLWWREVVNRPEFDGKTLCVSFPVFCTKDP